MDVTELARNLIGLLGFYVHELKRQVLKLENRVQNLILGLIWNSYLQQQCFFAQIGKSSDTISVIVHSSRNVTLRINFYIHIILEVGGGTRVLPAIGSVDQLVAGLLKYANLMDKGELTKFGGEYQRRRHTDRLWDIVNGDNASNMMM